MARLKWFREFAAKLIERSARLEWPPAGSEFWQDFERALSGIAATAEQADRASSEVCDLPGLFPSDYRPKVLEAVRRLQAEASAGPGGPALGSREEAQAISRGCPECGGSGISARYVHAEILDRYPKATVGASVSGWCGSCPHGRFLAIANAPGSQLPRTWSDVPGMGLGSKYCHRPSQWDDAANAPLPDPDPAVLFDRANLARALRHPKVRQDAPRDHWWKTRPSDRPDAPEGTPGPFPAATPEPARHHEPPPF